MSKPAALGTAAAVLVAAVLVAVFVGAADLNPLATAAALLDKIPFVRLPSSLDQLDRAVLFQIRLPRVVLGGARRAQTGGRVDAQPGRDLLPRQRVPCHNRRAFGRPNLVADSHDLVSLTSW